MTTDTTPESPAEALTDFIEDWYERWVDPDHPWAARDLAEAIEEWQASRQAEGAGHDAEVARRAAVDVLNEAATLLEPYSGIGLSNAATRVATAAWLRKRAEQIEEGNSPTLYFKGGQSDG